MTDPERLHREQPNADRTAHQRGYLRRATRQHRRAEEQHEAEHAEQRQRQEPTLADADVAQLVLPHDGATRARAAEARGVRPIVAEQGGCGRERDERGHAQHHEPRQFRHAGSIPKTAAPSQIRAETPVNSRSPPQSGVSGRRPERGGL